MHTQTSLLGAAVVACGMGCVDIPDYNSILRNALAGVPSVPGVPGATGANGTPAEPVHGTITVRAPGASPRSFDLQYCRSGQRESFSGVDLASAGPGGAVLRAVNDPIEGPRMRFQWQGGTPIVLDAAHCTQLASTSEPTNLAINRIQVLRGSLGLDCTLPDGTSIVGDAQYSSCYTSSNADEAIAAVTDGGRFLALPEIPQPEAPPPLGDSLRGLRVLPSVRIAGTVLGSETPEHAQAECLGSVRAFLQTIGWVTVHDASAPHDLDVQMACTGSVMFRSIGGQTEIDLPDAHGPSVRIAANGQTLMEIPPAPRQWRCPLTGDAASRQHDCGERLGHANDARLARLIAGSQPLNDWAAAHRTAQ